MFIISCHQRVGDCGWGGGRFVSTANLPPAEGFEAGPVPSCPEEAARGADQDYGQRGHVLHVADALYIYIQVCSWIKYFFTWQILISSLQILQLCVWNSETSWNHRCDCYHLCHPFSPYWLNLGCCRFTLVKCKFSVRLCTAAAPCWPLRCPDVVTVPSSISLQSEFATRVPCVAPCRCDYKSALSPHIFTMLFAKALGIIWYKSVCTVFRLVLECYFKVKGYIMSLE